MLRRLTSYNINTPSDVEVDDFMGSSFEATPRQIQSSFSHLRSTRFDFFFRHNGVDIPKCFRRSNSLRRQQHSLLFIRLVNFFMRHGLRLRAIKTFTQTLANLSLDLIRQVSSPYDNLCSWQQLYTTLAVVTQNVNLGYSQLTQDMNLQHNAIRNHSLSLEDQSYITSASRRYRTVHSNYSTLFNNIKDIEPLYNFFVYRVAKKIYKNTRGKSGRYTFI